MDLHDYIIKYPETLDSKTCKEIIKGQQNNFEVSSILKNGNIPEIRTDIRKCSDARINNDDEKIIFRKVGETINKYCEELNIPFSVFGDQFKDSGYDLLKYEEGEFYRRHTDDTAKYPRRFSMSIIVNDEFSGGDFVFFDTYKVKLGTGDCLVFPSNICFPHEVKEVKEGTRYSIVTWVF